MSRNAGRFDRTSGAGDNQAPSQRWIVAGLLAVAVLLPLGVHLGPLVFGNRSFAFRDAAHYYYPLYEWTCHEWAAGRVPLWNPQENSGYPVLADATSSVFYPGKLLFTLPLAYSLRYKLYIVLHVLLAGIAAYGLARHWHASRSAAALAAISYALGGNVLFQYCNVIYLVGAAWLPLAMLAADRMLVARSVRGAMALAVVLALMVLGGDPQAAYHAGLLAALYAWLLRFQDRRTRERIGTSRTVVATLARAWTGSGNHGLATVATRRNATAIPWPILRRIGTHRLALLVFAAATAFLLCAVQVIPAWQWTRGSERAAFSRPRSLIEIPRYLARSATDARGQEVVRGLAGDPKRGTHHEHIYHFSIGPWRFAECLWPNASGSLFPINRRWTNAIPAEGRIWTPSIYFGLLPLLLGLGVWGLRRGSPSERWLSWVLLLSVIGSLGWYGLGWLIQEVRYATSGRLPQEGDMGQPVGGLYWLMVVVLPAYGYFRFPAKLLVVAQLACSLLAARGLDRLAGNSVKGAVKTSQSLRQTALGREDGIEATAVRGSVSPRGSWLRWSFVGIAAVSTIGFVLTWLLASQWKGWLAGVPSDSVFGPLDENAALSELRGSFLHAVVLAAVLWILTAWIRGPRRRIVVSLLVLVTAIELTVAGHRWILTTEDEDLIRQPVYEQTICSAVRTSGTAQPFRVFRAARDRWWPASWPKTSSADRGSEALVWDRHTLCPRYPLSGTISVVDSTASCLSQDHQAFMREARRVGPRRPDRVREPAREVLDLLGAHFLLLPAGFEYPDTEQVLPADGQAIPTDSALWKNDRAYPRAWIVHEAIRLDPLDDPSPLEIQRRTREVLMADGKFHNFRQVAVVESSQPLPGIESSAAAEHSGANSDAQATERNAERCEILCWEPQRAEIRVRLSRPGLLVIGDSFSEGWQAERVTGNGTTKHLPILRTNRILRGVYLPAGEHSIAMTYRPRQFAIGSMLSAAGWLLVIGLFVVRSFRRRN